MAAGPSYGFDNGAVATVCWPSFAGVKAADQSTILYRVVLLPHFPREPSFTGSGGQPTVPRTTGKKRIAPVRWVPHTSNLFNPHVVFAMSVPRVPPIGVTGAQCGLATSEWLTCGPRMPELSRARKDTLTGGPGCQRASAQREVGRTGRGKVGRADGKTTHGAVWEYFRFSVFIPFQIPFLSYSNSNICTSNSVANLYTIKGTK
jgi:hypothetical protein